MSQELEPIFDNNLSSVDLLSEVIKKSEEASTLPHTHDQAIFQAALLVNYINMVQHKVYSDIAVDNQPITLEEEVEALHKEFALDVVSIIQPMFEDLNSSLSSCDFEENILWLVNKWGEYTGVFLKDLVEE